MSNLIYKKMSEVMKDVGYVAKNQTNSAQGFKFRGIDQFVNALYPALTKHGVFMTPRASSYTQELKDVTRSNGKAGVDKHVSIMMEYDFFAEDGSKVTVGPLPAEGLDSGDKATNKALSAALKYALIQTFSIPTVDMEEADLNTIEIGSTAKPVAKATSIPTVGSGTYTVSKAGTLTAEQTVSNAIVATVALPVGAAQSTTVEAKKSSSFRKTKPVTTAELPAVSTTDEWS